MIGIPNHGPFEIITGWDDILPFLNCPPRARNLPSNMLSPKFCCNLQKRCLWAPPSIRVPLQSNYRDKNKH